MYRGVSQYIHLVVDGYRYLYTSRTQESVTVTQNQENNFTCRVQKIKVEKFFIGFYELEWLLERLNCLLHVSGSKDNNRLPWAMKFNVVAHEKASHLGLVWVSELHGLRTQ